MPIDRDRLNKIRARLKRYSADVPRVRGNGDLSPAGRQKALARLRHDADTDVQKLRAAGNADYWKRRRELEGKAFSVAADYGTDPTAAISFRDAQDRVAQIKTGAEAQQMMRGAIRSGDTMMCKALFDAAWQRRGDRMSNSGWGRIIGSYVADVRPDLAPVVEELAALEALDTKRERVAEQIECAVPMPDEIECMSHAERQQAVTAEQQEEAAAS